MRKYGKYEKRPEGAAAKQPKGKSVMLQTYLTSLLCMILCMAMFLGTSYAWFTSEVSNAANEIYIGTLDVGLFKQSGDEWLDLSKNTHTLFDGNIRWEPGYTALETIQIRNEGDLSFRYELTFTDGGINGKAAKEDEATKQLLRKVAENFVVYVHAGDYAEGEEEPKSFADIKSNAEQEDKAKRTWQPVRLGKEIATLADILEKGLPVLSGNMEDVRADATDPTAALPGPNDSKPTEDTYIIALHMNGGEPTEKQLSELKAECPDLTDKELVDEWHKRFSDLVMGNKIGLNVKLTAYQRTHEEDSFDSTYDLKAHVTNLGALDIEYTTGIGGAEGTMTLDSAYQFQPVESYEEAQAAPYRYYIADFAVWADRDIQMNSIALAGYYSLFCEGWNNSNWVALLDDSTEMFTTEDINEETPIRLVKPLFPVTYELLCQYGNDGIGFLCGLAERNENGGVPDGTVVTVELRLYEVDENGEETGNYIVAGRYEYTFE